MNGFKCNFSGYKFDSLPHFYMRLYVYTHQEVTKTFSTTHFNSIKMKSVLLILTILALSGMILAKPTSEEKKKEKLVNALLSELGTIEEKALKEDEEDGEGLVQEDEDDNGLVQEDEEGGDNADEQEDENDGMVSVQDYAAVVQSFKKLKKRDQKKILAKLQVLKRKASTKAEAQFWHIFHHIVHHVLRHIYHYHYHHYY